MRTYLILVVILFAVPFVSAEEEWPTHTIESNNLEHRVAPPVDLDNDGDLDLIVYSRNDDELTSYLNDGTGDFSTSVLLGGLDDPRQVGTGDFDDDGDNDIAVVDNSTLFVYFNQGNSQFTQSTVDSNGFFHQWMKVRDIDLDGVPDLLLPYTGGAKWFRYDGAGAFDGFPIYTAVTYWGDTEVADIDGDGDNDFVTELSPIQTGIYWVENVGNTTFELRERFHTDYTSDIVTVDMNHDGGVNILLLCDDSVWCYSFDNNTFTQQFVSPQNRIRILKSADLDLDGDEDLVYYSDFLHRIGWSQYFGGTQLKDQLMVGTKRDVDDLYLGDFDQDQDLDFVAVERGVDPESAIRWWENPDYQIGFNLKRSVDYHGLVTLHWANLNASSYQIKRDGVVIATVTGTQYTDQLMDHLLHEYVVTANPQDPSSQPSYPVKAIWPDMDDIALLDEFSQFKPRNWSVEQNTSSFTWSTTLLPNTFSSRCWTIGYHAMTEEYWSGRLVSPSILKTATSSVQLMFDHALLSTEVVTCKPQYTYNDGATWYNLAQIYDGQENQQYFDLTNVLSGHNQFKIGFFFHADGCNRWAIDDVLVIVEEQPVDLELTPRETIIPSWGRDLIYDASIVSSFGSPLENLNFWLNIKLPGGIEYSRFELESFNLPAFADTSLLDLVFHVPGSAPAGEYLVTGYVGQQRHRGPNIQDQFLFVKEGYPNASNGDFDVTDWAAANRTVSSANANINSDNLPNAYALNAAYPNPFNPTTAVSVALPEAADLKVTVVNTLGQQVAELTNGRAAAGTHAFTFDASHLSSGIYFVHATVPGQLNAVQKVVLMK